MFGGNGKKGKRDRSSSNYLLVGFTLLPSSPFHPGMDVGENDQWTLKAKTF
jgi:hypothetical protein